MSRDDPMALATFEPGRFFVLECAHDTACAIYRTGDNRERDTCYGCREHAPSNVRAEHEDEGVRGLESCVMCHRGADKESAERGSGVDRKHVRD